MLDTIASVVNSVENFVEVQQETYFWTLALMLKMKWECVCTFSVLVPYCRLWVMVLERTVWWKIFFH